MEKTSGIVIWQNRVHTVLMEACLLVLDTHSWAQSLRDRYRMEASSSDAHTQRVFEQNALDIESWIGNRGFLTLSSPLLAIRQTLHPHEVNVRNFEDYLNRLLGEVSRVQGPSIPRFFFMADLREPFMLVTAELSFLAQFSGNHVEVRVVDGDDLDSFAREMALRVRLGAAARMMSLPELPAPSAYQVI